MDARHSQEISTCSILPIRDTGTRHFPSFLQPTHPKPLHNYPRCLAFSSLISHNSRAGSQSGRVAGSRDEKTTDVSLRTQTDTVGPGQRPEGQKSKIATNSLKRAKV